MNLEVMIEAIQLQVIERYVLIIALYWKAPVARPPLNDGQYTNKKSVPVIEMRSDK